MNVPRDMRGLRCVSQNVMGARQRRWFRPQGIAIPDEHMPPLEGTAEFDREVDDYYTLRLNQSFWAKQLHGKFLTEPQREELRARVAERQKHFSDVRQLVIEEQEPEASKRAALLLTKQFSEPAPPGAKLTQGDRFVSTFGPSKDQAGTVLGYRDGMLWYQLDIQNHPLPVHPSAAKHFAFIGNCGGDGELPDVPEASDVVSGAPVAFPKSSRPSASSDDSDVLPAMV